MTMQPEALECGGLVQIFFFSISTWSLASRLLELQWAMAREKVDGGLDEETQ